MMDIDTYLEIVELAYKHGKKAGDSLQAEFEEVLKMKKDKIKYLGATNKDADLLTGDVREQGLNILNLNEIERQKKR